MYAICFFFSTFDNLFLRHIIRYVTYQHNLCFQITCYIQLYCHGQESNQSYCIITKFGVKLFEEINQKWYLHDFQFRELDRMIPIVAINVIIRIHVQLAPFISRPFFSTATSSKYLLTMFYQLTVYNKCKQTMQKVYSVMIWNYN